MALNKVKAVMSTGLLTTANKLSELAGGLSTGYQNLGYGTLPVGVILPFPGATVPTGWLLCAGQSLSRTVYAELFAVLGTQYGSASGTTFNIPDLRGRVVAGRENMGGTTPNPRVISDESFNEAPNLPTVLGAVGGSDFVSITAIDVAEGFDNQSPDVSSPTNIQPTMILNYIIKANVNVVAVP